MEIFYCDCCHSRIPEPDVTLGLAFVSREGRMLCPLCWQKIQAEARESAAVLHHDAQDELDVLAGVEEFWKDETPCGAGGGAASAIREELVADSVQPGRIAGRKPVPRRSPRARRAEARAGRSVAGLGVAVAGVLATAFLAARIRAPGGGEPATEARVRRTTAQPDRKPVVPYDGADAVARAGPASGAPRAFQDALDGTRLVVERAGLKAQEATEQRVVRRDPSPPIPEAAEAAPSGHGPPRAEEGRRESAGLAEAEPGRPARPGLQEEPTCRMEDERRQRDEPARRPAQSEEVGEREVGTGGPRSGPRESDDRLGSGRPAWEGGHPTNEGPILQEGPGRPGAKEAVTRPEEPLVSERPAPTPRGRERRSTPLRSASSSRSRLALSMASDPRVTEEIGNRVDPVDRSPSAGRSDPLAPGIGIRAGVAGFSGAIIYPVEPRLLVGGYCHFAESGYRRLEAAVAFLPSVADPAENRYCAIGLRYVRYLGRARALHWTSGVGAIVEDWYGRTAYCPYAEISLGCSTRVRSDSGRNRGVGLRLGVQKPLLEGPSPTVLVVSIGCDM